MRQKCKYAGALVLGCVLTAMGDNPQADAKRPQYERMLQDEDAKRAAELSEKIAKAEAADQYDEAIRYLEELLELRTKVQGADHWEAVDERWGLQIRRKVAQLAPERRAGWREAVAGEYEAHRLFSQGHPERAELLERKYLQA